MINFIPRKKFPKMPYEGGPVRVIDSCKIKKNHSFLYWFFFCFFQYEAKKKKKNLIMTGLHCIIQSQYPIMVFNGVCTIACRIFQTKREAIGLMPRIGNSLKARETKQLCPRLELAPWWLICTRQGKGQVTERSVQAGWLEKWKVGEELFNWKSKCLGFCEGFLERSCEPDIEFSSSSQE